LSTTEIETILESNTLATEDLTASILELPIATVEQAQAIRDAHRAAAGNSQLIASVALVTETWKVLEYDSFQSYATDVMPEYQVSLLPDVRKEIVKRLRGESNSIRVIAATVGVGVGTVHRDIEAIEDEEPPFDVDGEILSETGEFDEDTPEPTVTGADGKTYPQKKKASVSSDKDSAKIKEALARLKNAQRLVTQGISEYDKIMGLQAYKKNAQAVASKFFDQNAWDTIEQRLGVIGTTLQTDAEPDDGTEG
jgi:hypothetical protein